MIVLPASTVIQINTLGIYDAPYPGGNLVTSPIAGSTVYIRANVSDPFGSYDITSLGLAVTGPSPGSSFTNTLTAANVVATNSTSETYEYPWDTGPTTGSYNIAATANEGTEGVTAIGDRQHHHHVPRPRHAEHHGIHQRQQWFGHQQLSRRQPVCVRVTDLNRNTNAATVETVIVTVTSSAGDSEILTLTETGTNTGIFTSCLNTSTSIVGAPTTARCMRRWVPS